MSNTEISEAFDSLAALMDIHGENSFKTKTYSIAAYNIERLAAPLAGMDDATLAAQPGIGDAVRSKIKELLGSGRMAALAALYDKTPAGVIEMMRIKGLGPKKIRAVWSGLHVETIGELEYACSENRLASLKGFGQKTQDAICSSIQFYKASLGFHLWKEGWIFARALLPVLRKEFPEHRFELTGALRRQAEIIETIEIVFDCPEAALRKYLEGEGYVVSGQGDENVVDAANSAGPDLKFYRSSPQAFFLTLFETTGSAEFISSISEIVPGAKKLESEESVFTAFGLKYVPPALREGAYKRKYPLRVIMPEDIRGIIHCHSKYSDGKATLAEMADAARESGHEYLLISDHSQSATYADGLLPAKVRIQHQEIDGLNKKLAPFRVFKGIESDILGDGSLDYSPSMLSTFDLVIASVHSNLHMSEEKAMSRLMAAIRNPFTSILGHPTGRLLLARNGYPLDHKKIIDACAEHDVVIEINASPRRLDLDWRWIEYALGRGVLLSIDPDAHSIPEIGYTFYGVMAAQKGGLTADRNLSSFSLAKMEKFIERQHSKRPS